MAKAPVTPDVAEGSNKPLPDPNDARPGTSGTELGLRANREKASSAFERAQRAEAAYRAKRRATFARKDYQDAKEHFRVAGKSLKAGFKHMWLAVKAGPAILVEKRENARKSQAVKDREKAEKKRQLWEEKANRQSLTDGEEAAAAPA